MLSMLQFASPERGDSLAAVIAVMAAPLGSDLNPARLDGFISVPSTVPGDDMIHATLAGSSSKDEVELPLSVTVTREGWVRGVSVLEQRPRRSRLHQRARRASRAPSCSRRRAAAARWRSAWCGCWRTPRSRARSAADRADAAPRAKSCSRHAIASTTAVATLFMASVARMITLRPASPSSSTTSNSSRRESGMPSFG